MIDPPPFGAYGRLDVDAISGRLLCHLCGQWYRNLAQHALRRHNVGVDEYRERFGLNRQTRLMSEEMRAGIRERTAPLIARLRAEGRLRNWREDRERWQRDKQAAIEVLHEGLRVEGKRTRRESVTPEDRERMAERTRQRNLAGTLRASSEAIRAGMRRGTITCVDCHRTVQRTAPRQQRCPDCGRQRTREQNTEAARRRRLRRKQGDEAAPKRIDPLAGCRPRDVTCPECGTAFIAQSHREHYCPPCRIERQKRWGREYQRRRRASARALPPESETPTA